jgi:uncharacterized membrane protein
MVLIAMFSSLGIIGNFIVLARHYAGTNAFGVWALSITNAVYVGIIVLNFIELLRFWKGKESVETLNSEGGKGFFETVPLIMQILCLIVFVVAWIVSDNLGNDSILAYIIWIAGVMTIAASAGKYPYLKKGSLKKPRDDVNTI